MAAQTLLFCIGAAKSGTSWLFDYLSRHRECHFTAVKELHYFDVLENEKNLWHRRRMVERLETAKLRQIVAGEDASNVYRERLISDLQTWLSLFDGRKANDSGYLTFLGEGSNGARVIGDFTPSYALLKEKTLRRMAALGERVRFVFVMREPVERLWSNIRMSVGRDNPAGLEKTLQAFLNGEERGLALRSNYRRTLTRLLAAVPRTSLHLEFYERLFSPQAIEQLCSFLGIAPQPAQFDRLVHAGAPAALNPAMRARLQTALKPQYNFVDKLLGGLPAEWTDKMVNA